jgi:hypothetical protein
MRWHEKSPQLAEEESLMAFSKRDNGDEGSKKGTKQPGIQFRIKLANKGSEEKLKALGQLGRK